MILSFEDVCFTYSFKPILDHVNLVINEKEKWGIVGQNGVGKSTLLRMMVGLEKPDSGEVTRLKNIKSHIALKILNLIQIKLFTILFFLI